MEVLKREYSKYYSTPEIPSHQQVERNVQTEMPPGEQSTSSSHRPFAVTSMYVGDLEESVTDFQLYDLFSQIGDVVSLRLCTDHATGRSLGYGYVNYGNPEHAERALVELNFTVLNGKPIRVMYSNRDSNARRSGAGNIFVKNLDKEIHHEALHKTFSYCGDILSCKVATDSSGQSMGYGFVQYATEGSAQQAIKELNGMILNGKQVYVGPFRRKQERDILLDKTTFTNVFVKNLSESTTESNLHDIFGVFGPITSKVIMRNADGTSKCFGFVNFENVDAAARAIDDLNGKTIDNKKWYVGRALKKSDREVELKRCFGSNLYVKNLDDTVGNDELKELFSAFGTITSCKVMRNPNGISPGTGFVAFSSPEEASGALSEMNGKMIVNKPLYVAFAQKKEDRKVMLQARFAQTRPIMMEPSVAHQLPIYGQPPATFFPLQPEIPPHKQVVRNVETEMTPREQSTSSSHRPFPVTVYVGDIEASVTTFQLYDLFSQMGLVVSLRHCTDNATGRSLGYGYIIYRNPEDAERALVELNFTVLNGKPIRVMYSNRDPSVRRSGAGNIFVKNLDKEIDHKALHITFSYCGDILSCKVATDSSGQSMGYGFVQYAAEGSAQQAIKELNGMIFNGKQVYVGPFRRKQERDILLDKTKFTNVFVKNLSESTTEYNLQDIFGVFGPITSKVIMRNDDGTSKCFGFVNFENVDAAARAIESLNGQTVDNKKWYVGRALKKSDREVELKRCFGSNLYMKNLDDTIGNDELKELFSAFGTITSCKVMRNPNGISLGSGFVAFSSPEEASRALSEMNGKMIVDKPLYVAFAQRKEDRKAMFQEIVSRGRDISQPFPIGALTSALANASPTEQEKMLGDYLYPLVEQLEPEAAPKVTGMILEMDQTEVLHLLESPEALRAKVAKAVEVLQRC